MKRFLGLAGLVGGFWIAAVARSGAAEAVYLLAPARYTPLQVAQDVLRVRDVTLISYQGETDAERPILHVWQRDTWQPLPFDRFQQAALPGGGEIRCLLVGGETDVPLALADAAARIGRVERIAGLSPDAIVNGVGRALRFRAAEWRWFARRYNMQLNDANAERRQHSWYEGRYIEVRRPGVFERSGAAPRVPAGGWRAEPATPLPTAARTDSPPPAEVVDELPVETAPEPEASPAVEPGIK